MNPSLALIVSTYNQPDYLDRCLFALSRQSDQDFELLIADDGSEEETRSVIEGYRTFFGNRLKHEWQADQGFRKTRILNRCILATEADYLVFTDGDCIAHPDFIAEHRRAATPGAYRNGAIIRLSDGLSREITRARIEDQTVFDSGWLSKTDGRWNRRYLKLSLPLGLRRWLNGYPTAKLYWLGSNSACWRSDAVDINGFDNRFTYGFEDGDFGNRLANRGIQALTVRWTANLLHLDHGRPYRNEDEYQRNLAMQTAKAVNGPYRAVDGLEELQGGASH
jgi:glycosyltransferase involved in cell wall biosynthesis